MIHSLTGRAAGLSFALALAVLAAAPAAAQVAADLEAMVTVDNVLDSVGGALPEGGVNLISRIVPSDSYFVAVSGTTVAVSTRFLREASRDALAAAVVRALHPDPVPAAVVLFRAGFNGPAGFAELYNRVAGLVALDAAHRAAVSQGARDLRDEINRDSFLAFAREGYHLMYRAHIESVRLRYHQAIDAQRSFQAQIPGSYSMPPVPLALVQAVDEVTAVLAGARSIDSSPWGSEIRAALGAYQPTVPPPPPGPPPAAEASAPGSRQ